MSPRHVIALAIVAVMFTSALAATRLRGARAATDAAIDQLRATERDIQELRSLRARQPRIAIRQRPQSDLQARVLENLSAAGLPSSRLTASAQSADRELRSVGSENKLRTQSVVVTLAPIDLPELGRFLDLWRSRETLWVPAQIELTRTSSRRDSEGTYSVRLSFSATYFDDRSTTP